MQLLARLMDHVLAERGERDHHRRRHLRRHRRGGDRGVPRPRQRRRLHPVPGGARVAGPAAADDDRRRRQRPRHRRRGHLRRLPGDREGAVRQRSASASGWRSPASTRSTGRASSGRSSTTSPPRWRSAARRAGVVHGADRQFRRHLRRLRRQAHGPAGRPAGDRHQRQRHPGAHARDRPLRGARRCTATTSPSMDIQVSSNFERLLFEAYGRDAARGPRG